MATPKTVIKDVLMSDPRYDAICDLIYAANPHACVLWIEDLDNPDLLEKYAAVKEHIRARAGFVEERRAFHGTKACNVDAIQTHGFLTAYNQRSAFGRGTYFARDSTTSAQYMDVGPGDISYMFVCDIALGELGVDTHVDSKINPGIFVVPQDYGGYPRFLVAFHKSAL
jgi:hypothetical protein